MTYRNVMKISLVLLALVFLAGCAAQTGPQATAVPATQAPTEVPATQAPTEVPATDAPAADTAEPDLVAAVQTALQEGTPILLTLEELAQFNGKEGKPALVAVDGILYDMTASGAWRNGAHNGFEAGQDLTAEIKEKSPHGVGNLERVKEVGRVKLSLNLEQLAAFNGKDGQRAYVAVDGILYDVTDSAAWKNGDHNGFEAGRDLTAAIKEQSPHGIAKLDNVVEIGVLVP